MLELIYDFISEERLTAEEILRHAWLNDPLNNFNRELYPKQGSNRLNPAPSMPHLSRFEAEI